MSQPQSATIVIDRPPAEVFAYMDDASREHEWQPNLRSAQQEPPAPSTIGTRKRYVSDFLGRTVKNTHVVTDVEPGRRIAYATDEGSSFDVKTEILCEPEDAGTRVTMFIDAKPRGVLKLVPSGALEAMSREELRATLARLKGRLETG